MLAVLALERVLHTAQGLIFLCPRAFNETKQMDPGYRRHFWREAKL